MFHMLSCFNLVNGVSINEFQDSNIAFLKHMRDLDLVVSTGPVGRRNRHPVMDTDKDRDQEYFYIMSFENENQCNRAVKYIKSSTPSSALVHRNVSSKIRDSVFICWEDI